MLFRSPSVSLSVRILAPSLPRLLFTRPRTPQSPSSVSSFTASLCGTRAVRSTFSGKTSAFSPSLFLGVAHAVLESRNDLAINGFGIFTSCAGAKVAWFIDPMGAMIISSLSPFLLHLLAAR